MGLEGAGRAVWEFRAGDLGGSVGLELRGKVVSDRLNCQCADGVRH